MPNSTAVPGPRLETQPFPTLAELEERLEKPLYQEHAAVEQFEVFIKNAIGNLSTQHWIAEFEKPVTVEDIGALAIMCHRLEMDVSEIGKMVESLRRSIAALDWLRRDELRRSDTSPDGIGLDEWRNDA